MRSINRQWNVNRSRYTDSWVVARRHRQLSQYTLEVHRRRGASGEHQALFVSSAQNKLEPRFECRRYEGRRILTNDGVEIENIAASTRATCPAEEGLFTLFII